MPERKNKIALVSDAFGHTMTENGEQAITNGTVKFTSNLAIEAQRFGVDLHLLTTSPSYLGLDADNVRVFAPERMVYHNLPPTAQTHGGIAPISLTQYLDTFRPDVLSLSTLGAPNASVAQKWAQNNQVPIVATIHTHPGMLVKKATEELGLTADKIDRLCDITRKKISRLVKRLDLVIVRSPNSQNELEQWGIEARYSVLKGGIDKQAYKPSESEDEVKAIRRQYGIGINDFVMIFVGRFSPAKESEAVLKTYREAKKEKPSVRLVVVGNNSYYADMLSDLGQEGIIMLGELPPEDVAKIIRSADIGIAPSPYETFGQAIAEMMSSGLPCLLPVEGGHRAFASPDSAILLPVFAENTHSIWVNQLLSCANDCEARRKIGQLARDCVPDLNDSFRDFIDIHNEVVIQSNSTSFEVAS
ncbi:glycosyltransferase family 4 protein [Candidatus Gracilibacteria bacterium]|nr:glycosyltransferase family 4 protein [Candidatus Gracilibacteria bacterium]